MSESIKTYIQDLFRYLEDYESNYSEFKTEAFFQTYNGIFAVFQALRKQRDKAVEVDLFFLENIKQAPLSSSDLRQLTIQILITFSNPRPIRTGSRTRLIYTVAICGRSNGMPPFLRSILCRCYTAKEALITTCS